eukprot:CAMPEP_0168749842 /NCGR_PEP_ID=MMETSP0724-20121128/16941_1 /TAXON_ID=265536 /ORGANISM="Amphiprora sp., Strain CCMP467" /LENGTH=215 /DNA_ID=CAMNT_0008797797 /DNA_START=10 /DNA_END=654 /DNA_ORIENTATION=+
MSMPRRYWETFNSVDSFLPLYVPLCFWVPTYLYCTWYDKNRPKKNTFQKWVALHNFHNYGAMTLATISINEIWNLNERVPILWSLAYFLVDLVDCLVRSDLQFTFHALCCIFLGLSNYNLPILFRLKMNSKASYCELSSPFLYLAKSTRNPLHFALFALIFTCCRIVWVPIMYWQCMKEGMSWNHPILLVLAGFYGLNCFWYSKIVKILYDGITG